jgi:hypothetical protein
MSRATNRVDCRRFAVLWGVCAKPVKAIGILSHYKRRAEAACFHERNARTCSQKSIKNGGCFRSYAVFLVVLKYPTYNLAPEIGEAPNYKKRSRRLSVSFRSNSGRRRQRARVDLNSHTVLSAIFRTFRSTLPKRVLTPPNACLRISTASRTSSCWRERFVSGGVFSGATMGHLLVP